MPNVTVEPGDSPSQVEPQGAIPNIKVRMLASVMLLAACVMLILAVVRWPDGGRAAEVFEAALLAGGGVLLGGFGGLMLTRRAEPRFRLAMVTVVGGLILLATGWYGFEHSGELPTTRSHTPRSWPVETLPLLLGAAGVVLGGLVLRRPKWVEPSPEEVELLRGFRDSINATYAWRAGWPLLVLGAFGVFGAIATVVESSSRWAGWYSLAPVLAFGGFGTGLMFCGGWLLGWIRKASSIGILVSAGVAGVGLVLAAVLGPVDPRWAQVIQPLLQMGAVAVAGLVVFGVVAVLLSDRKAGSASAAGQVASVSEAAKAALARTAASLAQAELDSCCGSLYDVTAEELAPILAAVDRGDGAAFAAALAGLESGPGRLGRSHSSSPTWQATGMTELADRLSPLAAEIELLEVGTAQVAWLGAEAVAAVASILELTSDSPGGSGDSSQQENECSGEIGQLKLFFARSAQAGRQIVFVPVGQDVG
jgi:hypothetical protein